MIINTSTSYGTVAKTFHWLTALLIFTMIPLGIIAQNAPFDTNEALARKALLFSTHKTLGIVTLAVALARILWAITQAKPGAIHPTRRAETFLAARSIGWRSILVGLRGRDDGLPLSSEHAELEIERIHDIERVLPELMKTN